MLMVYPGPRDPLSAGILSPRALGADNSRLTVTNGEFNPGFGSLNGSPARQNYAFYLLFNFPVVRVTAIMGRQLGS